MKLSVYSLKQILFQGQARSLNCKTATGEITVLDHHETLICALAAGSVKIIDQSGEEKYFEIKSGFLEVRPGNEARAIVEQ
jgi:F-type H+-transporting ATPase subunit epsilon